MPFAGASCVCFSSPSPLPQQPLPRPRRCPSLMVPLQQQPFPVSFSCACCWSQQPHVPFAWSMIFDSFPLPTFFCGSSSRAAAVVQLRPKTLMWLTIPTCPWSSRRSPCALTLSGSCPSKVWILYWEHHRVVPSRLASSSIQISCKSHGHSGATWPIYVPSWTLHGPPPGDTVAA